MKTLFDPVHRAEVVRRIEILRAYSERRWGRMTAPQMVAHLTEQMHHCLGDHPCTPVPGLLRLAAVRYLSIYWFPWPKGRIKGPPDAFLRQPTTWEADRTALLELVERFGERDPDGDWPEHGLFGRMSGKDWGFFCYKHFHHHLSQFGV